MGVKNYCMQRYNNDMNYDTTSFRVHQGLRPNLFSTRVITHSIITSLHNTSKTNTMN